MARIDYSISVTAIGTASGEGQTVDVIDQRVNRTLSGGNSSKVWVGTDTTGWSTAGVHTHVEAIATPAAVGAATATGASALIPNSSSNDFTRSDNSKTLMPLITSNISSLVAMFPPNML